ncbi:hypothetical protein, variant [Aphanomyces astaci]|uniref:Sugar phosphate transporter domain-containing protein n=1 Tax=Aphanomyces astaci TaxID=112090 RepID=W4FT08_APHAT|nr:hypothetical protein, variant [Aphanomyces astaci]ETV69994.1 hypothetical protein, variant [Aphanomyces astaci]|eukprot:XP_009840437.1 hypothetical protein, variant [Aphanomyces astaci]
MVVWYVMSLLALWANKFLVSTIAIDTSLLSMMQLVMSVACGALVEVRAVGAAKFAVDLRGAFMWTTSFPPHNAPSKAAHAYTASPPPIPCRITDMVTLGGVRILNLVCDLVALKYISVSLSQTIKSSAPFFTVVLSYIVLGTPTTWRVSGTLVPIVLGLAWCCCCNVSTSLGGPAFSFLSCLGLLAALSANCTDCFQNVLSKKLLTSSSHAFSVTQLQLYSSLVAMGLQAIYVVVDQATSSRRVSPDGGQLFVALCLMLNGMAYYVQSALAYRVMSLLSPVSHSVVSTLKRALLIVLSIYRYGEPATLGNYVGMMFVLGGVYLFHRASRHRSKVDHVAAKMGQDDDANDLVALPTTAASRHLHVIAIV